MRFLGRVLFLLLAACNDTASEDVWSERLDAALAFSDCSAVLGPIYGDLTYTGPLIDSHYHIPNLPDQPAGEEFEDDGITPILGVNMTMNDIVCTLTGENTTQVFAFFPVFPEILDPLLELANRTMAAYPDTFVPFIMAPDDDNSPGGSPTVTAEVLSNMLEVYPGLFKGYGEIGLYAREGGAAELPPDDERLLDIYPIIREHNLVVYFHLGEGHKDNFESVLEQNPDLNFIWHGDQLTVEEIEEIINGHPNAFYTVDQLYGDEFLIRSEVTQEAFLDHLENYEVLLEEDLAKWKAVIERHPDQFLWGTDRSPEVLWSHDAYVGQALSNYGRAFIARLDAAVQEKFAYRNAQQLIGED